MVSCSFRSLLWIALLVTEMSVSPALADDYMASAGARIYASASGSHGFPVTSNRANPRIRHGNQEVDVNKLLNDIRADVAKEMPAYSIIRSGEYGPGASGDFFVAWQDGNNRLDISCQQYKSREEATGGIRQLRTLISGGYPAPLPDVADEAYYLARYGWHIYFARRQFVCQLGGPGEDTTRRVTAILIRRIDQAVEK